MSDYSNYKHSDTSQEIISAAYEVYNYLGFGFFESVYEKALQIELEDRGFTVSSQQAIKVFYKKRTAGDFKTDLIVNDSIIIELKAVSKIDPKHEVQLVNYLRATEIEVGLVINFGQELKIKRRVFSNERKRNFR